LALLSLPTVSQNTSPASRNIIAGAALIALLYFGRDFFVTLIISAVFAFILDPVVLLVMKLRIPRAAATTIVIGLAGFVLYLLGAMAWNQIATINQDLPTYSSRVGEVVDAVSTRVDDVERRTLDVMLPKSIRQQQQQIQQKPQDAQKARRRRGSTPAPVLNQPPQIQEVRIHSEPRPFIGTAYGYLSRYAHVLVMASFVPFLIYFMLSWRDHVMRRFLLLFEGEQREVVGKSWSHIGDSTRAFVLGNFLLLVFLISASALSFFWLGLPYWPLIGLLSACCSLIPYVGLPLSALPPILAALAVPNKFKVVVIAAMITTALHVLSMNFLYAKVVGKRVRLNPLVVTIAMMFWGFLWGAVGLILAIPITAAIKAVCDNVESLEPVGRLLGED
jgi:predicted PurR-regulated permease PerM